MSIKRALIGQVPPAPFPYGRGSVVSSKGTKYLYVQLSSGEVGHFMGSHKTFYPFYGAYMEF